jgi:hypothetical protein
MRVRARALGFGCFQRHGRRALLHATRAQRLPEGPEVAVLAESLSLRYGKANFPPTDGMRRTVGGIVNDVDRPAGDVTWRLRDARVLSGRYGAGGTEPGGWPGLMHLIHSHPNGPELKLRAVRFRGKFLYFQLHGLDGLDGLGGADGASGQASAGSQPPAGAGHLSLWSTLGLTGGWTVRSGHPHARLVLTMEREGACTGDGSCGSGGSTEHIEHLYYYDKVRFHCPAANRRRHSPGPASDSLCVSPVAS